MSRTDKTRPWWVKLAEQPMVTSRPQHDHRYGPCTLPPAITAATAPIHRPASGCYWVATDRYATTMHNGCRECTGYWQRREARRSSRHESRRTLRDWPTRSRGTDHLMALDDDDMTTTAPAAEPGEGPADGGADPHGTDGGADGSATRGPAVDEEDPQENPPGDARYTRAP